MKIIDNTKLREQEMAVYQEKEKKSREPLGKWIVEKLAKDKENTIKLVMDWRLGQEFVKAVDGIIFAHQVREVEQNFLRSAISKRMNLKELIVESYDPNPENVIEILSDESTISALHKEAKKNGLDFTTYVRSIFFTTAYNINQEKENKRNEFLKRQEELRTYEVTGNIDQQLRRKLNEKFGEPDIPKGLGMSLLYQDNEEYGNRLIEVAKEYFNITEGDE